jgi:two-component system, cell cycle response regulator DivK
LPDPCSVLIVDRSEDSREVLREALQRRGMRIFATGRPQRALELAREHRPDLIVLDMEIDPPGNDSSAGLLQQSEVQQTPVVILGTVRRRGGPGEFIAKPYHYAPLIHKIEELLGRGRPALARSA